VLLQTFEFNTVLRHAMMVSVCVQLVQSLDPLPASTRVRSSAILGLEVAGKKENVSQEEPAKHELEIRAQKDKRYSKDEFHIFTQVYNAYWNYC